MKTKCFGYLRNFLAGGVLLAVAAGAWAAESTVSVQSYAGFTFTGTVGSPRTIQYVNVLASANNAWITLTNFNLPASPFFLVDTTSSGAGNRFYEPQADGVSFRRYPGLTITGNVGSTNLIQYASGPGSWTTLATVVLPASPHLWIDTISPADAQRAYRAVNIELPPSITSATTVFAQANYPFSYQITADSYLPVTGYGATGLPAGLSVNAAGLISGQPNAPGVSTVTVSATSANGTGSQTLTLDVRSSFAPELVLIPAGTFTLGSPNGEAGRDADEGPQTTVTVSINFSIGKYEVTQQEYQNVTGSNPSYFTGDPSRPVERVSWLDATNYCALLTARDLQAGIIPPNYTYRLPTEAEWEYAARGGTTTLYSFGNSPAQLGTHGWYADNSAETTHPVGQKLPNPWGLYDAHGNVWEWCSDWAGNYPGGSVTDPQGPASGTAKIIRGGSWFQTGTACRSANRDTNVAGSRNGDVGFRVVLAPVP